MVYYKYFIELRYIKIYLNMYKLINLRKIKMKSAQHDHSQHDFEHRGHHPEKGYAGRRGRLFESGKMKLLVLHLIEQQAKHGYEIIKDISDLVGGGYTPSSGTIYPTLTYLEEIGFVRVESTADDRKQYHITDAGKLHLKEQQQHIQHLLARLETRREIHENDQYLDVHRAMENLKTALRLKLKGKDFNAELVRQVAEIIDQAAVKIGRL